MQLIEVKVEDGQYFGFVLVNRPKLLVINEVHDFSLRGFIAFVNSKPAAVKKCPSSGVLGLGVKLQRLKPNKIGFNSKKMTITVLLEYLKESKKMTMVEFRRAGKDEYFFGVVTQLSATSFTGKFFSTNGRFEKEPDVIRFNAIKQIQWDSRYEKVMEKISKNLRQKI